MNDKKGFVPIITVLIIALFSAGVVSYIYLKPRNKPMAVIDTTTTTTSTTTTTTILPTTTTTTILPTTTTNKPATTVINTATTIPYMTTTKARSVFERDKVGTSRVTVTPETGTEVSGIISSDTTWVLENSPYIVTDNILVDENASLVIEPGVEVRFNREKYIQVMGHLNAIGTKENPIRFVANNFSNDHFSQDWELRVGKYREFSKGGDIQLKYCRIKYGLIRTESCAHGDFNNLMIENCTFNASAIRTEYPGIRSYIKHNTFLNNSNAHAAIYINGSSQTMDISHNNFRNNKEAIRVGAATESTSLRIEWNNFDLSNEFCLRISTIKNIAAPNNWWGTIDTSIIKSKISDFNSGNWDVGKVNYQPIATSEIPDAGVQ